MDRIRVLVVDDHPIFLEGFCTLVRLEYPEIEIVGAVSDGQEAVARVRDLRPDIVLMDIRMPRMDGVEAARLMRAHDPGLKIVMLTTFRDTDLIQEALSAGVKGYMLKETPVSGVIENIKSVHRGNFLLPGDLADQISLDVGESDKPPVATSVLDGKPVPPPVTRLTIREREILDLMLQNYSNGMIAERLYISERTVRNYVSKIYDVVGVHNRARLILWAIDHHLK